VPDLYSNLADIARAHGVSKAAVTAWTKKDSWPVRDGDPLGKAAVDAFVARVIVPHRKGKQRQQQAPPVAIPPAPSPAMPAPTPPAPDQPPVDVTTASLEDLERAIRQASSSESAERLSKQVRALKVVREIQDRDRSRIDASSARAEIRSVIHFFRTAVMNVARGVAGSLEGLQAAEIEAILEGRLVELLGELKRGLEGAINFEIESGSVARSAGDVGSAAEADAEPVGDEVPGTESEAVVATGAVG
jgi:hypothetical protein